MIFKQVFDTKTSTYTYLIASAKGREAVIIDPVLENVENYITLLKDLDLKLVKVIDTHIHADHVTGASKLKQSTSCTTIMGEHTPADAVEIKVKDNELINIDDLKIRSIYTPTYDVSLYELLKTYSSLQMKKNFQSINIPKLPVFSTEEGIKPIKNNYNKLSDWKNISDLIPNFYLKSQNVYQ